MGGPWEKYQKQEEGPWTKYQSPTSSAASDKGRHLSFEEGQALLEQERLQGASGEVGAGLSSTIDSIPVAGPYILGGVQRAAAGLSSLINGDSYDENLERAKDLTNTAQAENPIVSTAGRVAGSVLGTAPMVAAMPGAFGIGAGSLATRMVTSGLSGTALGATDAAVRSDGDLWETGKGALFGGTLGTLGPFVGDKVSQAYRAWAGNRATAEAARQAGTSKEAVDVVARSLGTDDAANAVNANIQAAGNRAMLADAGPATQSILDTAIQRAGPGAGRSSERIAARAAGATDDINNALDAALGTPQGMIRPLEELRTSTQPARAAAYDAAYAQPINYADPRAQTLEKIIKSRVPASIINRANNLMRINGEESQQILAKIADDGSVAFETLPDVRQLDYIKRALNDVARAGDGAGALGGNTAEGAAYGNLAKTIRDALSALVPEYRTAMKTAAEPIAQREAALFGQRMLSPSVARDEVEAFVSGLSDAELRSLRGGVRSKMDEVLANVKRAVSDGNIDARQGIAALRDLSSDAARQKIGTILSPQTADKFIKSVDEAAKSFELRASVAGNTRTYARQAAERAVEQATRPNVFDTAASGKPIATAQGFLSRLLGSDEAAHLARQDATWSQIADLLTKPSQQGGGSFLQALQGAAGQLPAIDRQAARIGDAVTRGVAVSSGPLGTLMQTQ